MDRIYIEIRGGVVVHAYSTTHNIEFTIVDWDDIEAGDKLKFTNYSPDIVMSKCEIETEIKKEYKRISNYNKFKDNDDYPGEIGWNNGEFYKE